MTISHMPAMHRYDSILSSGLGVLEKAGAARYLNTGCETGSQVRINREYLDRLTFETHLIGTQPAHPETMLFGSHLSLPVIASPLSQSLVLDHLSPWEEPYLLQIAGGLADAGTAMSTGMVEEDELGRIVEMGAPVIHFIKPYQDEERIFRELRAAQRFGCIAVGMDIEAVYQVHAPGERSGADYLEHKSTRQLREYTDAADVPFVVKGVLGSLDAAEALTVGAGAVMVSHHGGETIDYAVPVLKILPEVARAVGDKPVLVDTGFMRGTDVVKALVLGAHAVGVATLLLIACAAAGRDGVREMMLILRDEVARNLSLMGCADPSEAQECKLHLVPGL
jgi:4-hydroxymandelate oxidase